MAQNDAAFTGSIPQLYDEHMGALLFAPYAEDMAKRLSGMTEGALLETVAHMHRHASARRQARARRAHHGDRPQSTHA